MSYSHCHDLRRQSNTFLSKALQSDGIDIDVSTQEIVITADAIQMGPFALARDTAQGRSKALCDIAYCLEASTVKRNLMKLLRGLSLPKAILLEGSPGVGKTSLIMALGALCGAQVVRINLSEQTDMMDLLGTDLPQSGQQGFAWSDGVFLKAIKDGSWVLLDELNLASQSVLEGLNAVLDHRGTVYIPELDQEYECPDTFRVFAAQNPVHEGGGRKGLPASFLNRFTKVYLENLEKGDLHHIAQALYPNIHSDILQSLIELNEVVYEEIMIKRSFALHGAPFEFNLRDAFRCCDILKTPFSGFDIICAPNQTHSDGNETQQMKFMGQILDLVYLQRMRTNSDRIAMMKCFTQVFGEDNMKQMSWSVYPDWMITDRFLQIGHCMLPNQSSTAKHEMDSFSNKHLSILFNHRTVLQHTIRCVNQNWPILLVGPNHCGKTSLIRLLSQLTNHRLHEFAMTPEIESSELLGCFEQVDVLRHIRAFIQRLNAFILQITTKYLTSNVNNVKHIQHLLKEWKAVFNAMYFEADDTKLNADDNSATITTKSVLNDKRIAQIKQILNVTLQPIVLDHTQHMQMIQTMKTEFEGLIKICKAGTIGHFEWIDGTLIDALEKGEWILLENVNFCNPSVLDRLNPLLEPNGVLLVNECGLIDGKPRIITPHKDFRIFFTMNPKFGEISRAMRNRCVEIAILDETPPNKSNVNSFVSPKLNDLEQLLVLSGVEWTFVRNKMIDIHCQLLSYISQPELESHHYVLPVLTYTHQHDTSYAKGYELTKWLLSWSSLLSQQLEQGCDLKQAMCVSFAQTYANLFYLTHKQDDSDISVASLLEEFMNDNVKDLDGNQSITFDLYCSQLLNHMQRTALSKCIPIMDHQNNRNISRIWLDLFKISPQSLECRVMESYYNTLTSNPSSHVLQCFPQIYESNLFQNYIKCVKHFAHQIGINPYVFLQNGLFYQNNAPFNEFIQHQLDGVSDPSAIAIKRDTLHLQQQLLQIHNQHCLHCMIEDAQLTPIKAMKNENLNQMTVLQLSYALQHNKALVNQHKLERRYQFDAHLVSCMQQMMPLFEYFDQWLTSLLCLLCEQQTELESLLNVHQIIANILSIRQQSFHSLKYVLSEFKLHHQQIRFRELLKRIEKMYDTYPIQHLKHKQSLMTALVRITNTSSMKTVSQTHQRAKNRLYRYGGQGFISRNKKIGTILQVFNALNKQISFASQVHWNVHDIHSANTEHDMLKCLLNSDGDALCYLVNYEWKYNLVNAWSTVHFLQTNFPGLFSQLSHEMKSIAITPPKRNPSEQMALDMFDTIQKAGQHLDTQLIHFSQQFQAQLAKIQHKVKIDLTSDELSKIYFDPLEDDDDNEIKMEREIHTKQFLMSIDFSAKKHHIWLHLAPILTGIYLQKEYNDIVQQMPQFLVQSLHNKMNDNTDDFSQLSSKISSSIHHGLSIRSLPAAHFVPLQSMMWTVNVLKGQKNTNTPLPLLDMKTSDNKLVLSAAQGLMYDEKKLWYESLRTLYPGMDVAQFVNSGVNSIMIMNILKNMADHDVSIHNCNSMIAFLQHLTNHLATDALTNKHTSTQDDGVASYSQQKIWKNGAYLVSLFCLTLSAFHRAFEEVDYQHIVENGFKLWQNWHCKRKEHQLLTCSELDNIMKRSTDVRLQQMTETQIVTNLYGLCVDVLDDLCMKKEVDVQLQLKESNMWLLLGLLRLHLLFPARFFDPNLKFEIRLNDVESILSQLFEEIELRKRIELFHSGKQSNYTIHNLQQKYKRLLKDRSSLLSKVTYRPESELSFADFWHELTNFINNQFECNQLIQLFANFVATTHGDGHHLYQRIQSILQTSLNFIHRLHDRFSHFNDFVAPIIDAIELIRYGLSYGVISCNASSSIITSGIKQLLSPIAFSMDDSLNLMDADLHQIIQKSCDFIRENKNHMNKSKLHELDGKKLSSKVLLSGLKKSINFVNHNHITHNEVEVLDHWFSLFVHLFHEQEEQRRVDQMEKESLYKFDSKQLEEESKSNFWELFPDYLLDFRHLTASKTLHHKTQMKQDFAKLESRLTHDPTIMQKHQDIMEKQHTQQQLDDVLLDEHTLKPVPSQFARPVGHKTNHKFAASLSTQDIKEIFTQHLNTFSNKTTTRKSAIKEISESLSAQHRIAGILTELLSVKQTQNGKQKHYAHGITVDNTVDDIGAIAYLLSSTDLFSRFTSKSIKCNHPIDVYTQSVPSFIRIVEKPLQALSVRIAGLLTAYPSHSVLLQLSELCSHLSALSIRSPIMKVLTGLELLLSKAKSDWEDTCAARHTSIQTQLNPIFKLIGFWRKLELQSWSAIFERKEEEICDAAIHNWFYLYSLIHTEEITDEFIQSIVENRAKKEKKTLHHEESFIKNASSLNPEQIFGVKAEEILQRIEESRKNPKERFGREEKHEIFLEEMFNHLNEFLESSPIGEIDIRLTMIRSFYLQMNCELHTHYDERRINDRALRVKLLRMIGNLIDYHVQFESVIIEYKKEKFEPMKAKLKELVKFSKWDLRNYWQLRESAQKSHRKLAKLCYDWKIALKRSVSGILAETDTKQTNEMAKKDPKIEFGTAEMYMKIVQKNTFLKRILSKKRIKPSINEMDVTKQCPWLVQKPSTTSVGNSTKLIQKMHKLQTKFYSDSHWKDRAQMQNDIESLCSSIIITTKEYAKKDIPSPRKQRVLSVLLSHLKQNGLRLFAPGDIDYLLPSQLFLNQSFTSKDALFAIRHHAFNEGNAGNDKYNEWFETLTQKSQDYYQNIIRKMCQLRARRMSVHPDVHQEANKCYGVTEQLLSCLTFQRSHLDELLKQITTLQQWHINIQYEVNTNTTTTVSSLNIEHFFWSIRDKFTIITQCVETLTAVYTKVIAICKDKDKKQNTSDKSLANQIFDSDELAQFEECIPDFIADDDYADDAIIQSLIHSKTYVTKQYDESLQQMKSIASKLKTYQRLFDDITTHKLSPQQYESMYHEYYAPVWSSHSFTKLSSVHDGLRTIYASLQSLPCFSNLNISIPFETTHESLDNAPSNKDYVQCYESVIEEIQLCIQDVLHVIHAEEFNSESKYFEFQHQSFTAITKAFHGKEIAQKLLELMHVIPHQKLANDSLNNLLLMMRSVIDIGRFALNHNICCHKSFCKLEYVLTSLFNGLFVKGFCKTEDEEKEEDGEEMMDNELGDGVGMADGEGIEDVSHEMENEGQVEGLENDKPKPQQQQKKDKPDEDEDIGVEMEQDFDGELEDVEEEPNQKNKGDESDDEDLDDIDREMGDIDFNKSQVIDERMWGSEDEEAEEEDDHEEDGENDRNENQQINAKDEHSQVQAKQKTDESNKKADPNEEEEENNEQKKDEEAVAQLEFGDPLEDLDENVSDEEAMTEKKDMKTEDGEMDEAECPQRKQFDLDNDMDIEFSDSDKEEEEDETEKGEQDQLDLDALEKELAEKDKEREEEKMEDLQRGAGEIMPENEAKDDALEFLNDDEDEEADGEDGDEEETQAEAMDIDKEKNENEDGNTLQPEEADEEDEDANAPNNSDILKPNIADVDEEGNAEKEEDKGSDVEMEANEDEEAQEKDEAKQNEEEEMEDANLETDQNDADQNNDEAMGVYGGMGDTAPVGDDEEDEKEEDLEMKEDQTQMEQQMSDVFGDDQQMMQQDKTKGEWQPMNQSQKREEKKSKDKEKKEMDEKSNPFRSLGDALSEWKQRLEIIQQDENAQKEANRAEEEDADDEDEAMDADNYAHVPDDMNVENETQALMDNQDEDMTHLPNIADINNEEDAFDDDDANDSDVFDEAHGDQDMEDDEDKFDPYKKHKQAQTEDDEEMDKNKQKEVELRDLRIPKHENDDEEERKQSYLDYIEDLLNNEDTEEDDTPCRGDTTKKKEEEEKDEQKETDEEDEEDGPTAVEIAELRATLDKRLSAWHGSSLQSGDEIWRKLCLVTQSLSQQLCEELRTILEPLQMTKLGGDFRSGKRINMKKVIPYIASQFRKDKIWLRRCKPHKRNYQILVCIDDSESMRENSAGRLALESMCILTRALNKLEVGSIGVLSFGQTINLLHSLQRPFSDGCGSFVCSQFSFAQRETKYQDLIATIINVLSNNDATWTNIQEHMKQNTSIAPTSTAPPSVSWDGSETLSLIFIISDARIQQDRKQLQQLVRVAHERKQIVLMIIVDSNDENTSIVNVKSIHVDPLTNKVNISSYLDEFPFPYYVLLKDIQTLPNVIADSLRQWFELIRQSS